MKPYHPIATSRLRLSLFTLLAMAGVSSTLWAEAENTAVEALLRQLLTLKQQQRELDQKIDALESALNRLGPGPGSRSDAAPPRDSLTSGQPAAVAVTEVSPLTVSGDLRLRHESNHGDADASSRHRGVIRGRLRAEYALLDSVAIGAELVTGDADDPNTADLTLSNFVDDIEVGLSQAYARLRLGQWKWGQWQLYGGKFPNPLVHTDLVWDGDVNPQGGSIAFATPSGKSWSLTATGLYFIIDEDAKSTDSDMIGGQVAVELTPDPLWRVALAAAHYDYRLHSLSGADTGDFRSNLRAAGGGYLSDFNLTNVTGSLSYLGLGQHRPLRFTGDYVDNAGAANAEDSGYSLDIALGRASSEGDWRLGYRYMQAEVDAVLAAFSHDNFTIATNYRAHQVSLDYVPREHLLLNATWYHYRPLDPLYAGPNAADDWLERVRLNFTVSF